jgi:isopentenyl diphosphate isomerase/L-lactate dehydrogenase-like FMN-dependent dehydrogenase
MKYKSLECRKRIDMTTEILGATYDSPIVIAPTGSNRAFHPD